MATLTQSEVRFLLTGRDPARFFDKGNLAFGGDRQRALAAWKRHRARLLDEWVLRNPGTRPAAFWRFDAPEPRRLLNGKHPGRMSSWQTERDEFRFGGELPNDSDDARYETEAAYLRRLGLLSPAEIEALAMEEIA